MSAPIPFRWDGQAMRPLPRLANVAGAQFEEGRTYTLAPVEDRSSASHRHYFAEINEAWQNLPESFGDTFPTAEHLRKNALIRAGYRDERQIVASSRAEAVRLAAFIKPMDEYAVVTVRDAVVTVYTAKSQNLRAMDRATFQQSKDAVLGILSEMVGVTFSEGRVAA